MKARQELPDFRGIATNHIPLNLHKDTAKIIKFSSLFPRRGGFFTVAGSISRPALPLGLLFCRINFPGAPPLVASGDFVNWHKILF